MESSDVWNKVLSEIKPQISFNNFKTWFSQTKASSVEESKITIVVPSSFHKNQLLDRYEKLILDSCTKALGREINIEITVDSTLLKKKTDKGPAEEEEAEEDFLPVQTRTQSQTTVLNPKYTLESFVVGQTNNLAFAAAQAVVANPGISYNPLFIYGPSGVGKTHLMQGIGNALLKRNPQAKLIYASSERFMNDLVEAIQRKTTVEFRQKYRNCDIFLIDDIQFISGRDATQEAFFHTFNELQGKNSQIIINSDRTPNEIMKLEPRLASRFAGGMMVDIQLPDFDTRMAILKAKLAERKEFLSEELLIQIAQGSESKNTRELEGKLIQILQLVKTSPSGVTPENLKKYLDVTPTEKNVNTVDKAQVLIEIKQFFNLKIEDLTGPRRQKELVLPRQIAMFILYTDYKLPFEKIGEMLGGRDHTTVMHGVEKIKEVHSRDREIQRLIIEVRQRLSA